MEDGIKLALATLTGIALFRSAFEGQPPLPPSMGPLPAVSRSEEGQFELLWEDKELGRVVLEGQRRTRLLPPPVEEVLAGLSRRWVRFLIDEASSGSGTGTAILWVRADAVKKVSPSSTWAFHQGEPKRTSTLILFSGRHISGVLP